ncbi:hypothetical protein AVEN_73306-1 [Araneus ventricosus]|uniref:Ig-like domain-containing protein n=1 Tax=Araneus ventricosus TaxID=182803 RepID=A0A4Y2PZM4_ARAVE|nr:hypothetical protein AVEN_73306-1 [Araneus ventricosus]
MARVLLLVTSWRYRKTDLGYYISNDTILLLFPEKIETVIAVEGGKVDLQCDITPPSRDDDVALVLWYKDESTTPLYSLDSRRRGLYQAKHAPGQEIMGRAFLDMSTHPTVLKLEKLKAEDEGEYRCRVDFKIARSRNSLVILEIIIPPKKPVIKDINGEVLQRVSGAHNLGSRLVLICEVEGGKPPPSVTWWKDSVLLDDTYQVHSHVVRNELVVDSLDRNDLHTSYACHASNNNISLPAVTSVMVDMNPSSLIFGFIVEYLLELPSSSYARNKIEAHHTSVYSLVKGQYV